jgi:hypothetical protein
MYYGSTTEATDFVPLDWKSRVIRAVFWFIPSANPDFERLFPLVRKWLVEIDDDGNAQREVALSADGAPLFAAPDERNCGFWTDSSKEFARAELGDLSAAEFEAAWALARTGATMPNNALQATREDAHA